MEEKGYIEINLQNSDNSYKPSNVDISDIKNIISDIENLLFPSKSEKAERPQVSYLIEEGSVRHKFYVPITSLILFQGIAKEINKRNSIDFLDFKRAKIIERFQKYTEKNNLTMYLTDSQQDLGSYYLEIGKKSNYIITKPEYVDSEFYIYGEIYQEGGKTPNLHIVSKEYGNMTISATKDQLLKGEKRLYKTYGIKARGKQNLEDGQLSDLELVEFLDYTPRYNKDLLDSAIKKATENLADIDNVDKWIDNLRHENYE